MKTLYIIAIGLLFFSCHNQGPKTLSAQTLQSFLTKHIKQQAGKLHLKDFNCLTWDEVQVLPPYSNVSTVDAATGPALLSIQKTGIANRDDVNVLAFFYRKKFVGCMEMKRNIDFAPLGETLQGSGRIYSKADCIFEYHRLNDGRYAVTAVL